MHFAPFSTVVLSLASLSASSPLAKKRAKYLAENDPWKLSNIHVFEAKNGSDLASTISFDITDSNEGLAFSTSCSYSAAANSSDQLDSSTWHSCGLSYLNFHYTGDSIYIQRYYKNPAVSGGTSMDTVTCYGDWPTSLHPFEQSNGTSKIQGCMEIYCTTMVA